MRVAAETLKLCFDPDHLVVKVVAPKAGDRLITEALSNDIHAQAIEKRLEAHHVLDGTDLIIAAHAHCYITDGARARSRFGAIGYHPSLLPLHRGRDAVAWAIHMHEPVIGGSVYWMDGRADGGPVIGQDGCFIRPNDTAADLWRRDLAPMGLRLFRQALERIASGNTVGSPQDEALATWEPSMARVKLSG